ncbi:hypothetical protein AAK882_05350 [Carnobacteriaceae bacterium 52-44]
MKQYRLSAGMPKKALTEQIRDSVHRIFCIREFMVRRHNKELIRTIE